MNIQQNFKVGDKVFYPPYGIGIVKDTDNGSGIFPILASFESGNTATFTRDGRDSDRTQFVSLFKGIPVYNEKTGELEKVIPFEKESGVFDNENLIEAMTAFLSGQTISRKTDENTTLSLCTQVGRVKSELIEIIFINQNGELKSDILLSELLKDDWIIEE